MMGNKDTFLGNTCVSGWVYYYLKLEYNNPLIWHLILDDNDFIKICKKFTYYINQEPKFISDDVKNGRYLTHPSISKTYPIMRLDDINIHFIHHKETNIVYDKFCRRRDRMGDVNVIPVVWDKEIKDKSLITKFNELNGSILAKNVDSQVNAAKQIIKIYGR